MIWWCDEATPYNDGNTFHDEVEFLIELYVHRTKDIAVIIL
jgi:hypothetical protein